MVQIKLPITAIIITDRADDRFSLAKDSVNFAQELIIEEHQEIKDFAKVRNQLIGRAKNDWILFLDSDEFFDNKENLVSEIEAIINTKKTSLISIKRVDIFHGQKLNWGETKNNWLSRIFDKNYYKYSGAVHEKLAPIIGENSLNTSKKITNCTIVHHSHLSITEFISDVVSYSKIHALNLSRNRTKLILEVLFFPSAKFFQNFVLKLGFLDGWRGMVYALVMSLHSLISRVIAYENASKNNS